MKYGDLAMGDYYDATEELKKYYPEKIQEKIDKGIQKIKTRREQIINKDYGPHLILKVMDWWNNIPCPHS